MFCQLFTGKNYTSVEIGTKMRNITYYFPPMKTKFTNHCLLWKLSPFMQKIFSTKQDIGIEALEWNHPIHYSYSTISIQSLCNY